MQLPEKQDPNTVYRETKSGSARRLLADDDIAFFDACLIRGMNHLLDASQEYIYEKTNCKDERSIRDNLLESQERKPDDAPPGMCTHSQAEVETILERILRAAWLLAGERSRALDRELPEAFCFGASGEPNAKEKAYVQELAAKFLTDGSLDSFN